MTDTTDITALREFLMEQIDHVDSYGGKVWLCAEDARITMESLNQLEAERQQREATESYRNYYPSKCLELEKRAEAAEKERDEALSQLAPYRVEGVQTHVHQIIDLQEENAELRAKLAAKESGGE